MRVEDCSDTVQNAAEEKRPLSVSLVTFTQAVCFACVRVPMYVCVVVWHAAAAFYCCKLHVL